jgi:selenide,water dikinase
MLTLNVRRRGLPAPGSGEFAAPEEAAVTWEERRTALLICDMWDKHWCAGASRRVDEMAPYMDRVVRAARARGVLIIHAPSETMDFYAGTPQRRRAAEARDAGFPEDVPPEVISEVFRGGAAMVGEAGGAIAGGHTIYDREPKYGLCVTGIVHPERIARKSGARPGDLLYLTKPLGTGLITTAAKRDLPGAASWLDGAIEVMLRFNRHPSHLAIAAGVRTMTDVTGFGLLGHADEIARASGAGLTLAAGSIPLMAGALESVALDVGTGGAERNEAFAGPRVSFDPAVSDALRAVLWDPQTAGGLLIAIAADAAEALEASFAADGLPLWRIGSVREGAGITVKP